MVYLLHFATPYRHARHYVGYSRNRQTFARRREYHRNGTGARLMEVVCGAGIDFTVGRTWQEGDRTTDRRLKNSGGASRYCPVCRASH